MDKNIITPPAPQEILEFLESGDVVVVTNIYTKNSGVGFNTKVGNSVKLLKDCYENNGKIISDWVATIELISREGIFDLLGYDRNKKSSQTEQ